MRFASQIPCSERAQPWVPSSQAWRVGERVGVSTGAKVGGGVSGGVGGGVGGRVGGLVGEGPHRELQLAKPGSASSYSPPWLMQPEQL